MVIYNKGLKKKGVRPIQYYEKIEPFSFWSLLNHDLLTPDLE